MMYLIGGLICVIGICVVAIAILRSPVERELRRFHPPDDDDGISLIDDPDGQYTR